MHLAVVACRPDRVFDPPTLSCRCVDGAFSLGGAAGGCYCRAGLAAVLTVNGTLVRSPHILYTVSGTLVEFVLDHASTCGQSQRSACRTVCWRNHSAELLLRRSLAALPCAHRQVCATCPTGGYCPGQPFDSAFSTAGYWGSPPLAATDDPLNASVAGEIVATAWRNTTDAQLPRFYPCTFGLCLRETASGSRRGSACRPFHTGVLCGICAPGAGLSGFYCRPCRPRSSWADLSAARRAGVAIPIVLGAAVFLVAFLLLPLMPGLQASLLRAASAAAVACGRLVGAALRLPSSVGCLQRATAREAAAGGEPSAGENAQLGAGDNAAVARNFAHRITATATTMVVPFILIIDFIQVLHPQAVSLPAAPERPFTLLG